MTLDADIQASLSRHRERELAANPDVAVPWDVSTIDTTDRQSLQSSIEEAKKFEGIVLVDMPGTLNASNLNLLYQAADLAVVPISYDFDTIDATGIFIKVIKRVKDIRLVFLPNRINTTEHARGLAIDINTLYNPYYKVRDDGSLFTARFSHI